MKSTLGLKTLLFVTGLIGVGIGGAILLTPVAFHATSGIVVVGDESLMNEMRAAGGALFACGFLVLLGAFVSRLTYTALVLSTALYMSYGLSRLLSMAVDGMPSGNLVAITLFELGVGLICALALTKSKSLGDPDGNTAT